MLRVSISRDQYFCRFSNIVFKTMVNDIHYRLYIPCKDQTKCSRCKNLEHTQKQVLKCRKLKIEIKESIKECERYEEGAIKDNYKFREGLAYMEPRVYNCTSCNLPMVSIMSYTDTMEAYRGISICRLAKISWKKNPFGILYFPCEIKPPERCCFTCKNIKETKDLPKCLKWGIEIQDPTKQCEYYVVKKKAKK